MYRSQVCAKYEATRTGAHLRARFNPTVQHPVQQLQRAVVVVELLLHPVVVVLLLLSDGVRKGESGGVSGHGLLLRASGAEAQSSSEEHSLRGGPVQDVERRRVSF